MLSHTKIILLVLYSFFIFNFSSSSSPEPRTAVSGLFCGVRNSSSTDPNYIPTFVDDMQSLSSKLTTRHFATQSINSLSSDSETQTTSVFALAQCHNDLSPSDCQLCYAIARTRIPRCLPSSSARIFLDGCFLRYDTYEFYDESISAASDRYSCSNDTVLDPQFGIRVSEMAVRAAVRHGGFGVAGESGVHALAQCWESVGKEGCRDCLEKAIGQVKRCVSRREGRAMNSGCYLRYSDHKFYNGHGHRVLHGLYNKGVVVAIVLTMSALVMLILLATYVIIVKVSKTKQEALDPCLNDEKLLQVQGSQAEVCKVLCVGLLCAQASPSLRPSMDEVIRMLTERDYPIPSPTNPPFLRISSLATECSSTASCSSNSTTMVKTDLASYTSSESFATRGS
ncbi:hypothetical protein HID58_070943 [Brassica napus]|uniref:Gnk2-homologous domain-containing protein n=1 Tax=Brassica napus TaxID=3708 RepID=A0ABQ7Z063_BRANA|nr:hypothetical protein HID58_070943 [Brassica napus]